MKTQNIQKRLVIENTERIILLPQIKTKRICVTLEKHSRKIYFHHEFSFELSWHLEKVIVKFRSTIKGWEQRTVV